MNPLLRRLAILRVKVRLLDGWQGICAVITLVLTVGVSVGTLDYFVHLPTLARAAVLVGLLIGAAAIVYRYLVRPFGKPCDNLNLALRIEEEFPELNDALASTVQFLNMTKEEQARLGASESMRARTVAEMIERSARYDFACILNRRAGVLFGVAAVCALGVAGWLGAAHSASAQTAFWRLVEPFGMHTWTKVAVLRPAPAEANDGAKDKWDELDPRSTEEDRIAIHRPYLIKVVLTGQIPKHAKIEIEGKIRSDMTIDKLTPSDDEQSAFFVTPINMTQHYQQFKFRVVANDGAFPPRAGAWHKVEVMHEPKLIDLEGLPSPQITVYPPAYTDLPSPVKLLPGTSHIEVYAGSRAVYRARADRPLTHALIRWQPDDPALLELAQIGAGAAVPDKAAAVFEDKEQTIFSIPLVPWASGKYVLYMRDKYGLETEKTADIRVVKDPVPVVKLLRPALSAEFAPDAVVPFKFFVSDEKFAVRSVYVEYRRKALDGTPLDDNPTRAVLYEAQTQGKLIPWQLAQALGSEALTPDLRLRRTKLGFDMAWALKNHKFKEGELVVVEVCADDFCNIYPKKDTLIEGAFREPGRSQAIELRIVSKREIIARAEQVLGQIQKDLERAAKLEQKALDTVREIRKEDKIDQAVKDKLTDGADGPQKDVHDIVGKAPEDGIRGELNKLRQTLKANNLDNTRPFKEAGEIKGALDNIAQEELQQLEPNLNEIRADLNRSDKNNPRTKAKLDETARLQQNVADTLNELIGKMDPGAKMRDIRNEVRDIIGKEQQLREDLAELKAKKAQEEKETPQFKDVIEKDFKKKIEQKADEQRELAQQLDKLLKEMNAEKDRQEKLGNKGEAQKIGEAIKQIEDPGLEKRLQQQLKELKAEQQKQEKLGNKEEAKKIEEKIKELENPETLKKPMPEEAKKDKELPLNAQMKEVAKNLRDRSESPQQALDQQQKISKQLEKALETLEGKNPDLAKQEIKDRKDTEKKIDEHIKELKRLQEEDKQADKIKDMQERLKKKEEIAEKLEQLEQKMEKTRRQLAQLQEQQAAKAMKDAIEKVEKAGDKVKQGQNAEQEQQDARKKLEEAKLDVQESEEELAREMLIKIADQLKGLKERQDASLKRTENLHPKVMKRKSWSEALLNTLDGNIDGQTGIAEETGGLQKKLEGAVVFGGILERAKKSMDSAGTVMDARKKQGFEERRYLEKGDGEVMDADAVKDETEAQSDTVKHQKQAARSLTNLLDALKEEIDKPRKKPKDIAQNDKKPDEPEPKGPKGGVPNQDGIPPMAQLKALKAEQLDLNERTIDFDKRNPDPAQFNDRQRAELRELEAEQDRLQQLFHKLTAPPQKEGEQP